MRATKIGLFIGQQLGKETQKEVLKAMHRNRSRIANIEIVINGPQKDKVREEIRAASSTM